MVSLWSQEGEKKIMFTPVEVKALPGHQIWLRYSDGVQGKIDLNPLIGKGVFSRLRDEKAFQSVHIGSHGSIEWGDDLDLCPDALYLQITGKSADQVFPHYSPLNA